MIFSELGRLLVPEAMVVAAALATLLVDLTLVRERSLANRNAVAGVVAPILGN